jgi:hypothetical protein
MVRTSNGDHDGIKPGQESIRKEHPSSRQLRFSQVTLGLLDTRVPYDAEGILPLSHITAIRVGDHPSFFHHEAPPTRTFIDPHRPFHSRSSYGIPATPTQVRHCHGFLVIRRLTNTAFLQELEQCCHHCVYCFPQGCRIQGRDRPPGKRCLHQRDGCVGTEL